jgi:hypothetical protein
MPQAVSFCHSIAPRERGSQFAVTQVTRNIAVLIQYSCMDQRPKPIRFGLNLPKPGGHTMYIYHTCKVALLTLIGLFAVATVVMNSSAASSGVVAANSSVGVVDCNTRDPFSRCFVRNLGHRAGVLFVVEDSF